MIRHHDEKKLREKRVFLDLQFQKKESIKLWTLGERPLCSSERHKH